MAASFWSLDPKRRRDIARLAEDLALQHSSGGPIDVQRIARDAGIEIIFEDFPESFDGFCGPSANGFAIVCNRRTSPPTSRRTRYTIAHELGHYFIPDHREKIISGEWPVSLWATDASATSPAEREADWFAANLLLPESAFRAAVEPINGTALEHVESLARHFEVSNTACAFRMLGFNLLPPPAAIYRWNRDGKLGGRQMSEATFRLSLAYRKLAVSPPENSVTANVIDHRAGGIHYSRTPVMKWFPNLSGYDRGDNALLNEEVMSLGEHGWLTIVHAVTDVMSES